MNLFNHKRHIDYTTFFIGISGIVWQLLFFYVPLLVVVAFSFSGSTYLQYFTPFFSWVYVKIIVRSLLLAFGNALLCILIAYPFSYFLAFRAGRFKYALLFLVILPFWNNFLLHISAWTFVLDKQGVLNTLLMSLGLLHEPLHLLNSTGAVLLMMVYFYMPFMVFPLYTTLERFDKRLFEASYDLGATWWQTTRRVLLPLSMPGIRSGFFLVFIPSFGEFVIPEFMGGDKTMYVGSVVSHFILGAQTAGSGAAFTVLSSIALMLVAGFLYWVMGNIIKRW